MLPDEVRKAVEYVDQIFDDADNGEWATIKAHLLAREAEVDAVSTELRTMRGEFAKQFKRAERAEALLREAESELRGACLSRESARISQNIRAHLSENSRG